jgi:hypothetical protein
MRKAITMLLSVGTVVAAGALALAPAANAAAGCRVVYAVHGEWPGGFTAGVQVTNLGAPLEGWTLRFSFPADQQITNGWSASWSQAGPDVTAGDAGWNAALATGASAYLGFNGASSGPNPEPTAFTLNGSPCTGSLPTATPTPIGTPPGTVTPPVSPPGSSSSSSTGPFDPAPVVTLISPLTGDTFTAGDVVLFQASATIEAPRGIVRLEFLVDNVLVGTAPTTSPGSLTWTAPAGAPGTSTSYTVVARAISTQGFPGVSRPAVITVVTP